MTAARDQTVDSGQLRQIIAGLSDGVILLDERGAILWANDAALAMHGAAEVEALGGDANGYRKRFQLRYRNHHRLGKGDTPLDRLVAGETFDDVVVQVTPEGEDEPRWTHQVRSLVLAGEKGKPALLVLVLQDVSARFEAEQRFERAFSSTPRPPSSAACRITASSRSIRASST